MIPAYSKEIQTLETPKGVDISLEEQVKLLHEQVRILRETIDYVNRERSRMKGEIESLKAHINRRT